MCAYQGTFYESAYAIIICKERSIAKNASYNATPVERLIYYDNYIRNSIFIR